MCFVTH